MGLLVGRLDGFVADMDVSLQLDGWEQWQQWRRQSRRGGPAAMAAAAVSWAAAARRLRCVGCALLLLLLLLQVRRAEPTAGWPAAATEQAGGDRRRWRRRP